MSLKLRDLRIAKMHKKYKGRKNNKRIAKQGFSLVEIVTTVAIIGILAGVAVPNYERIKLQMNMEMVKQHMRIIGEKLTEIIGKQGGQAPSRAEWGNPTPGDEDEVSLTATLSAIDQKGYTTEEWTPPQENLSDFGYEFLSCPKDNAWGSAGDRCYRVTPNGVEELPPGVGKWMGQNTWNEFGTVKNLFDILLNTSSPNKLIVLNQFMLSAALLSDFFSLNETFRQEEVDGGCNGLNLGGRDDDKEIITVTDYTSNLEKGKISATSFIQSADNIGKIMQLLEQSKPFLESKGIHIETRVQSIETIKANCNSGCQELDNVIVKTPDAQGVEITFKLDNRVDTRNELHQRLPVQNISDLSSKL